MTLSGLDKRKEERIRARKFIALKKAARTSRFQGRFMRDEDARDARIRELEKRVVELEDRNQLLRSRLAAMTRGIQPRGTS